MFTAQSVTQVHQLPLCIDLDGTLIKTDILIESLILAAQSWRTLQMMPALAFAGKAGLKDA